MHVITAPDDAPIAEIAALLSGRRIGAVPIVDRFDVVVGLVSRTDLHDSINIPESARTTRGGSLARWISPVPRWPRGTAAALMSSPPLTIQPEASLPAASRAMYRRNVGRLLVVDGKGRLRGIVTRSDLLKVHGRLDAVIREEVTRRVLRQTLMIEPGRVQVAVDDGVVTLSGRTRHRTTALAATGLTEAVPGVTAVIEGLAWDNDDTAAAAAISQPVAGGRLRGWWIGRQAARPADAATGQRVSAHSPDARTTTTSAASK